MSATDIFRPVYDGASKTSGQRGGFTVWFTGLSGSGKSTLAHLVAQQLAIRQIASEILDGDEMRNTLCRDLGFSRKDRDENVYRLGCVAGLLSRHHVVALVAAISPFRAAREEARTASRHFLEVYVDCSLEALLARDVKGLYRRALAGEITRFTGISDPYEAPIQPDLHLKTDCWAKEDCVGSLMARLEEIGWLARGDGNDGAHRIRRAQQVGATAAAR